MLKRREHWPWQGPGLSSESCHVLLELVQAAYATDEAVALAEVRVIQHPAQGGLAKVQAAGIAGSNYPGFGLAQHLQSVWGALSPAKSQLETPASADTHSGFAMSAGGRCGKVRGGAGSGIIQPRRAAPAAGGEHTSKQRRESVELHAEASTAGENLLLHLPSERVVLPLVCRRIQSSKDQLDQQ